MAGNVSKNAHREGAKVLMSRWGGAIKMKSVFENGKLCGILREERQHRKEAKGPHVRHFMECKACAESMGLIFFAEFLWNLHELS